MTHSKTDAQIEAEFKRDEVAEKLKRLKENYLKCFGVPLPMEWLKMEIDLLMAEVQRDLIRETLGHLIVRHSFDVTDLQILMDMLTPKEAPALTMTPVQMPPPVPSISAKVAKRERRPEK